VVKFLGGLFITLFEKKPEILSKKGEPFSFIGKVERGRGRVLVQA